MKNNEINNQIEKSVQQKDGYGFTRFLYILEAAFEYFISILVGGAYIAKVTEYMGIPDGITGILSSLVSLGFAFQLVAIFLANKRPVKRWVSVLHIINQLLFSLVYFVAVISFEQYVKIAVFVIVLVSAHAINNVVQSPKISWYMEMVDDKKRGSFTATKEIVSLLSGLVFTLIIGSVIDHFEAQGSISHAFVFSAISIVILTGLHTATLLMSKEKPVENPTSVSTKEMFVSLLKNKTLFKIIIFNVIWRVIEYLTTPFMGTFQNKELGFSMTFVAALSGVGAITRAVASRPMGKMADKLSFRKMLTLEFVILVVSLGINALSSAQIGKYTYCVYVILHSVCLAGINSGTINLMYDFVPHEYRTGAYALQNTIAGSCGFLASLLGSAIVDIIQKNGNTLLGIPVYAQQVLSLIAMCIAVVGIVYLSTVIRSLDKKKTDLEQAS